MGRDARGESSAGGTNRPGPPRLARVKEMILIFFFFFLDSHVTWTLSWDSVSYLKTFPNSRVCTDLPKHRPRGRSPKGQSFSGPAGPPNLASF